MGCLHMSCITSSSFRALWISLQNSHSQVKELKQLKMSHKLTSWPEGSNTLIYDPHVCDGEGQCSKEVEVSLTVKGSKCCAGKPIDDTSAGVLHSIHFRSIYMYGSQAYKNKVRVCLCHADPNVFSASNFNQSHPATQNIL